jgi:hypothetical protein
MSKEIVEKKEKAPIAVGNKVGGLVPTTFEAMYRLSEIILASEVTPKGMDTAPKVFAALQLGAEIGLMPMQSIRSVAVINGRPSVWGDAALGLVRASGLLERFKETPILDNDGTFVGYHCKAKRLGVPDTVEHEFTLADAKEAGLLGKQGPWAQYKKRMCQMRARSYVLRDLFTDQLFGIHLHVRDDEGQIIDVEGERVGASEWEEPKTEERGADSLKERLKAATTPQEPQEPSEPEPEPEVPPEPETQGEAPQEPYTAPRSRNFASALAKLWDGLNEEQSELMAQSLTRALGHYGATIPDEVPAADRKEFVQKAMDEYTAMTAGEVLSD